jgi:hypothetical protein
LKIRYFIILFLLILTSSTALFSQGKKHIIQLSGIIVGEDSLSGAPGVHVYVPKAGRGTTTNMLGYFSMPVLANDSVVISAIGYKKQSYIVPEIPTSGDHITLLVELVTDVTYLETVQIMSFPTEQLFKQAIVALNLPIDGNSVENEHLNADLLAYMASVAPMDAGMNYRNYMNDQIYLQNDKFMPRTNPLLNPFKWAKFIQAIKNGDFKKK